MATFVMRQHEYLVALKAENGLLTLHTLHWADEIRDLRKEIDSLPGKAKASAEELTMAEQLIEALTMEWDPEQFHADLYEKATAPDIPGRSHMPRDDLVKALSSTGA
ncbi:Ku protein [Streptomyces sp. 3211]|uniref:Ku protein n=1 Tax=Streptomyces sp. 3211 TaxID=1964449 RepID=UPI003001977D